MHDFFPKETVIIQLAIHRGLSWETACSPCHPYSFPLPLPLPTPPPPPGARLVQGYTCYSSSTNQNSLPGTSRQSHGKDYILSLGLQCWEDENRFVSHVFLPLKRNLDEWHQHIKSSQAKTWGAPKTLPDPWFHLTCQSCQSYLSQILESVKHSGAIASLAEILSFATKRVLS